MRKMLTFGMILVTFIYFIPVCYLNYGSIGFGRELTGVAGLCRK